ncbi:MAG: tripartite tricarboxylate transporter substrate binding protein BugE [Curvibacter sp.]|nr:tripartite tricarboxylate transporter substrate binding protein BugE [Curvibacter sp.]
MNHSKRRFVGQLAGLVALTGLLALPAARADDYPNRPIRLIVPFAAGGTTDLVARAVSQKAAEALGQPLVVENHAGGGGSVGAAEVARAQPDGYILGVATVSTTATNPATNAHLPYNPLTDFTPIVNMAATPNILAANPAFPARDYAGFVAEVKKKPGQYGFGTAGTGSIAHMLMALYQEQTGLSLTHVPYRGSGPALIDAVSGQVPLVFDNLPSALPFVKSGRLVALAVASPKRLPQLPEVPTFKELGVEPVNRMAFYGLYGPKGLPKAVVDRVNAALLKALADPGVKKQIEGTGSQVVGGTPEQFARDIAAENAVYKQIATKYRITVE